MPCGEARLPSPGHGPSAVWRTARPNRFRRRSTVRSCAVCRQLRFLPETCTPRRWPGSTGTAAPGVPSRALRPATDCSPRRAPAAVRSGWRSASPGRRTRPPARCWGWRGCGCAGGCAPVRAPAGSRPATMPRRSRGCVPRPGFLTRRPPYPAGAGWRTTFALCQETGRSSFQISSRRASGGGWALICRPAGNRRLSTSPWTDAPRASRCPRGKPCPAAESARWSSGTVQTALPTAGLSRWAACGAGARSGSARGAGGFV